MSAALKLDLDGWVELKGLLGKPGDDPLFVRMRLAYTWAMRRVSWIGSRKRGGGGFGTAGRFYTPTMLADDAMGVARSVSGNTPWPKGHEGFYDALAEAITATKAIRAERQARRDFDVDYAAQRKEWRQDALVTRLVDAVLGECCYSAVVEASRDWYSKNARTDTYRDRRSNVVRVRVQVQAAWYSRCYLPGLATIQVRGERKLVVQAQAVEGGAWIRYLAASSSRARQASTRLTEAFVRRDPKTGEWRIARDKPPIPPREDNAQD